MLQKALILAFLAAASSVSAIDWKQCEPYGTKIKSVNIPECDSFSPQVCVLRLNQTFKIEIDYEQPKPLEEPRIMVEFTLDYWHQSRGCNSNLKCPAQAGEVQQLRYASNLINYPPHKSRGPTMRVTVRENTKSLAPAQLCVDIPLLLAVGNHFVDHT